MKFRDMVCTCATASRFVAGLLTVFVADFLTAVDQSPMGRVTRVLSQAGERPFDCASCILMYSYLKSFSRRVTWRITRSYFPVSVPCSCRSPLVHREARRVGCFGHSGRSCTLRHTGLSVFVFRIFDDTFHMRSSFCYLSPANPTPPVHRPG